MSWTLNNVKITVIDLKQEQEQIVAELQPLASGTIYQVFGFVKPKFPLQCLVVGFEDRDSILSLTNTGLPYALSFNGSSLGDFYVTKAVAQWATSYRQTFRPDKSDTDLVFKCALELSKA